MIPEPPTGTSDRVKALAAALFLVAGAGIAYKLWGDRGPLLAVVAGLTFATIAAGVLHVGFRDWLRRRPYLDALLMLPASLALVAFITELPLATCLTIAVFLWLALTIAVTRRRQREQLQEEGVDERDGWRGQGPDRPHR
jgi:hypothetical protein